MIETRLRRIGPAEWFAVVVVAGIIFLVWHAYWSNSEDVNWHDPQQPPDNVPLMTGPLCGSGGRPMETGGAFRGRAYPNSLVGSDASIIGTF